jgi:hypothetical protein
MSMRSSAGFGVKYLFDTVSVFCLQKKPLGPRRFGCKLAHSWMFSLFSQGLGLIRF